MTVRTIQEFAGNKEIPKEQLKASTYFLNEVDQLGVGLATSGWSKAARLRVSSYVKAPSEYSLVQLSNLFAEKALSPSNEEMKAIKGWKSSIADRIDSSITLALVYARALDGIKVKAAGINSSTKPINSLMGVFLSEVMWRANINQEDIDGIRNVAEAVSKTDDVHLHWYIPKMLPLSNAAELKRRLLDFLPAMRPYGERVTAEQLAADNDELFASTVQLQRYGVKPCIAPALPQSNIREWLVSVPQEEERGLPTYHPGKGLIVYFHGSNREIKSTEMDRQEYVSPVDDRRVVSVKSIVAAGIDPSSITISLALYSDGHLHYAQSQKILEYLDPALRLKYEQLRSEILSIYFDSVVPVFLAELVNREASLRPKGSIGRIAIGLKKIPDLRKLVLARKRMLDENINSVIEELTNPELDLVRSEKKKLTKHDVVWHIRKLPPEYRASAEARAKCLEEAGIILADYGETYVSEHTRGSLERPTKGYKASFVLGKMAAKRHGHQS